jgi:hypothetical protein
MPSVAILIVTMLNGILQSVVLMSVVVPRYRLRRNSAVLGCIQGANFTKHFTSVISECL